VLAPKLLPSSLFVIFLICRSGPHHTEANVFRTDPDLKASAEREPPILCKRSGACGYNNIGFDLQLKLPAQIMHQTPTTMSGWERLARIISGVRCGR
jgi:hypothetical protein